MDFYHIYMSCLESALHENWWQKSWEERWRVNNGNISFRNSLQWPVYIINSVDYTPLWCSTIMTFKTYPRYSWGKMAYTAGVIEFHLPSLNWVLALCLLVNLVFIQGANESFLFVQLMDLVSWDIGTAWSLRQMWNLNLLLVDKFW